MYEVTSKINGTVLEMELPRVSTFIFVEMDDRNADKVGHAGYTSAIEEQVREHIATIDGGGKYETNNVIIERMTQ